MLAHEAPENRFLTELFWECGLRNAAIGIFDSGIGGLTVAREIARRLPHENLHYLGDTARLPYGSKSPQTVTRYARKCIDFLRNEPIKAIVVACNTASALALPTLQGELDIPALGVVEAGARSAVASSRGGPCGVIGQEGTVRSGSYSVAIRALLPTARIVSHPCPLLVPLAEEGWVDTEVARLTLRTYLAPLAEAAVDTLVLGCTHYPLFKSPIGEVFAQDFDRDVTLVDSAEAVTDDLVTLLAVRDLLREGSPGTHRFSCTDAPERFERVGLHFFGKGMAHAELVDI